MGAWGTGIYDNDTTLDFMGKVVYMAMEEAESNEEILVAGDLISKYSTMSPLDNAMFVMAIDEELNDLECWDEDSRESRKEELLKTLGRSAQVYKLNDDLVVYPYKIYNNKIKCQFHLKVGEVVSEWVDLDDTLKFMPIYDCEFTINEYGLVESEVEKYFECITKKEDVKLEIVSEEYDAEELLQELSSIE